MTMLLDSISARLFTCFLSLCVLGCATVSAGVDASQLPLLDKMQKTRIPEIDFRQANICDVVAFLNAQSKEFDPHDDPMQRSGVSIVLNVDADISAGMFITFSALDITLKEALDYSVDIAGLQYNIAGYRVVIVPRSNSSVSRGQEIDTNFLSNTESIADGSMFGRVATSLAIITTPQSTASGFIAAMEGEFYLVTNEHAIRTGRPKAMLLNGQELDLGTLEIADRHDLARFELNGPNLSGLLVANKQPSIGQSVFVFGNSDGGGVFTSLAGNVLGVGPDRIEISATFVQGNSGSPIVGTDKKIYGVATYAVLENDPRNWVKQGSRFDKVRRFGLRLNDIDWVVLEWEDYTMRAQTLVDLSTYVQDVYDVMYTSKYFTETGRDKGRLSYSFNTHRAKYLFAPGLCRNITKVVSKFNEFMSRIDKMDSHIDDYSRTRDPSRKRDHERSFAVSRSVALRHYDQLQDSWRSLYSVAAPTILRSDWKIERFSNEANILLDALESMVNDE